MKPPTTPRVWVIALVALVVFANALAVAWSAANNRANYSQLVALHQAHDQLVVRRGQLELEVLTLASHARVAHLAETKMNMRPPEAVHIVRLP